MGAAGAGLVCIPLALRQIASGSEVALALQAYEDVSAEGVGVRVVSLPSCALFGEQDRAYRDLVLPPGGDGPGGRGTGGDPGLGTLDR